MKPSHLITPRTLAECTFEVGYALHSVSDRPSLGEFIVAGSIGLTMILVVMLFVIG